jgi:hypothetical protein
MHLYDIFLLTSLVYYDHDYALYVILAVRNLSFIVIHIRLDSAMHMGNGLTSSVVNRGFQFQVGSNQKL